jgi:hypothetical protein
MVLGISRCCYSRLKSRGSKSTPRGKMPHDRSQGGRSRTDLIIKAAFARLDAVALAIAGGTLCASVLFFATAWLLLRGAPSGVLVGPHLGLLVHFLPGYSVTWVGSLLGICYGFVIGFCAGAAVGLFWNLTHHVYLLALIGRDQLNETEV